MVDLPKATIKVELTYEYDMNMIWYEFSKSISRAVDRNSGFDSIYTYDHFLPYYAPNNKYDILEFFTLLSAIASITNKVKLGRAIAKKNSRNMYIAL